MDKTVTFRQLKADERLDAKNAKQIAKLIYETDPFIYPCMFNSKEDALLILPRLFYSGRDRMFTTKNCFVAEQNGIVIGLILWYLGPLRWDSLPIKEEAAHENISLQEHFSKVEHQYFESYMDVPDGTISLINICISDDYRNQGIGTCMLRAFLEQYSGMKMELYVLADNMVARKAYENNGFRVVSTHQGFSSDNRELPCLLMELDLE